MLQSWVYRTIKDAGDYGVTDDELFMELPTDNQSSIRPRRIELVRAGLVKDSGRKRKTSSGRQATVWIINESPSK